MRTPFDLERQGVLSSTVIVWARRGWPIRCIHDRFFNGSRLRTARTSTSRRRAGRRRRPTCSGAGQRASAPRTADPVGAGDRRLVGLYADRGTEMRRAQFAVILLSALVVSAAVLMPSTAPVFRVTVVTAAHDAVAVEAATDSAGAAQRRLRPGDAGRYRPTKTRRESPAAGGAGCSGDWVSGRRSSRAAPQDRCAGRSRKLDERLSPELT